MSALREFAVGLTRAWVALYTRGLPAALRDGRRAEIDSDLWEHGSASRLVSESPGETALQVFMRFLLGLPADLLWRLETGRAANSQRRSMMNESLPMRALVLLGLAVAAFPLVIGVLVVVGLNGEMSDSERVMFGPLQVLIGGVMITGLLLSRSRPRAGLALIAAGALAISAMWYWVAVITVPIGLGLIAIAYFRGRRPAQPNRPQPA